MLIHGYKSINLIGEDKDTTVIDGGGNGVVHLSANSVNINGFTVQNASSKIGIQVSSNYNNVSGNIISNSDRGILISSSFGNIIAGNTIFGHCNCGIKISSSSPDNIVTENILLGWHRIGICLSACNNTISANNLSGGYYRGISLAGKDNVISENIISGAGSLWGGGIYCYKGSNTFSKNEISSCGNGMKLITDFSNIKDNIISNNNDVGIYLSGVFNSVSGNIIKENKVGLDLFRISNIIWKNSFRNNSDGISLYHGFSNIIRKNNFVDNTNDAYFEDSLVNRWKRNYWDKPGILYVIKGKLNIYPITPEPFPPPILTLTWFNFDLFPAQEPYDIEV